MKILLDTNFLIYCAKQKIDYKEEIRMLVKGKYDLVVIDQVIQELKDLKNLAKKYTDKQAANLALQILKANNVKTQIGKEANADSSLISQTKGNIIATLDLELAEQLPKTIIIRGKKKLIFR